MWPRIFLPFSSFLLPEYPFAAATHGDASVVLRRASSWPPPAICSLLSPLRHPYLTHSFFLSLGLCFLSLFSWCPRCRVIEQLWSSSHHACHREEVRRCQNIWVWPGSKRITTMVVREHEWRSRAFTAMLCHSLAILMAKLVARLFNIAFSS